jgi:WD40 repeat protein
VLDPTTGLKIAGLGGLSAPVSEMRSAGGALVITGVENGQIRIWNAATREPVAVGTGVTRLDANLAHDRVAIMQDENRVLQIRSDLGDTISTLTFEKPLKGFDIDAAASSVALLFEDGTLEVRDTATSGVITAPLEQVKMLASQGLSADGQRLAYVADDNRLVVVDVASSSPLTDVQFPTKTSLEALLSADGRSLFVSERGYQGRMAAFTVGDATPRWEYRGRVREDETAQNQPGLKLRHFFAAPDGSRILVIEDDSPNGEFSVDHAVLLDGLTGAIISVPAFSSYESITSGAFSRYGSVFVTSSYSELGDGGGVKVWDAATGVLRSILEDDAGKLSAIDFTEDAKRVAYADGDGRINLWATDSGRKIGEISSKLAGRNMRSHTERLILIGDELWVQESTGALMSFETPRQRHSPMIAKDACSMLSGAGVEAFTLEEQASFGISDKRLQPCNVKGAFSWRFYAKASHEVWQRLEQRICGLLN